MLRQSNEADEKATGYWLKPAMGSRGGAEARRMSMKSSQQAITHLVNAAPPPSELIFVGTLRASA
jgi:hypothetical protein